MKTLSIAYHRLAAEYYAFQVRFGLFWIRFRYPPLRAYTDEQIIEGMKEYAKPGNIFVHINKDGRHYRFFKCVDMTTAQIVVDAWNRRGHGYSATLDRK